MSYTGCEALLDDELVRRIETEGTTYTCLELISRFEAACERLADIEKIVVEARGEPLSGDDIEDVLEELLKGESLLSAAREARDAAVSRGITLEKENAALHAELADLKTTLELLS